MGDHEKKPSLTPLQGVRHEVPPRAVLDLQRIWTREKMVGMEVARASRLSHRLGLATTLIATVTSLGIFTTLQGDPSTPARVLAGVVTGIAAVLSAWQTYASKQAETERQGLTELLQGVIPLREKLVQAVSECQMSGIPVDAGLLDEAESFLAKHEVAMPGEYPSFGEAEKKAKQELHGLGLLSAGAG
jgi:hypothetical protein